MFPTRDILDLIDHKGPTLPKDFYAGLVQIIEIDRLETQEAVIFKIQVDKPVWLNTLSQFIDYVKQHVRFPAAPDS